MGAGDSYNAALSPEGRFVLFASTAPNLASVISNQALPFYSPIPLNVFVRDRSHARTTLVSVDFAGAGGAREDALPLGLSTNGQQVLFESAAANLVEGDENEAGDVFVRDLAQGRTVLVSANTNGVPGNGLSTDSAITPDGRYVVFTSEADDLVPGDLNGIADVFVRDLMTGLTTLVSAGAQSGDGSAWSAGGRISADGRYVAFGSNAQGLAAGVPASAGALDAYVRDRVTGQTQWASAEARALFASVWSQTNITCGEVQLSQDARFVAFVVSSPKVASGMVLRYATQDGHTEIVSSNAAAAGRILEMALTGEVIAFVTETNRAQLGNESEIQVWDAATQTSVLASVGLNGTSAGRCEYPVLSADGQKLLFVSDGTNLVAQAVSPGTHVYVRDLAARTTHLADAGAGQGTGTLVGTEPVLSADGRVVGFDAWDSGFVSPDLNRAYDVFVRELAVDRVELVSAPSPQLVPVTAKGGSHWGYDSMSRDGRFMVFESDATDLVPGDAYLGSDIFLRDVLTGTNALLSVSPQGQPANGDSTDPAITSDGRFVVFTSKASNFAAQENNGWTDVFARDLKLNVTTLLSWSTNRTTTGNAPSSLFRIAPDRNFAFLSSQASDLGDKRYLPNVAHLFSAQLPDTTLRLLTPDGGGYNPALSRDGGCLAALMGFPLQLRAYQIGNSTPFFSKPQDRVIQSIHISPDSRWTIYFWMGWQVMDRLGTTNQVLLGAPALSYGPGFASDSRFFAFSCAPPLDTPAQIYLHDFISNTNELISQVGGQMVNGDSDQPTISENGRLIAFRSRATNLHPAATQGFDNIYLLDRSTRELTLISRASPTSPAASGNSRRPIFAADGRHLLFESSAWDLVENDFNNAADIFAYTLPARSTDGQALLSADQTPNGMQISWPIQIGCSYRVEFNAAMETNGWQPAPGPVSIEGGRASYTLSPTNTGSFYRVVTSAE